MRRKLFFFFVTVFSCLFFFPLPVLAQVVLNEFCPNCDPEWVELFNNSSDPVDLEGWEIQDDNLRSTDDLTITQAIYTDTTIPTQGFMVFQQPEGVTWLNNSGDTLKLFDNSAQLIDSFSYSSSTDNKTYSRIPDGEGSFVADTEPTFNQANQALPTPTSTPQPTSTPTPTHTATPTPVPSTPTPTQITAPSSVRTYQSSPSPSITPTGVELTFSSDATFSTATPLVLGDTQSTSASVVDLQSDPQPPSSASRPVLPRVLVALGGTVSLASLGFWGRRHLMQMRAG